MELVVQKYGGTSVGTVERIAHVADHIAATVRSGKKAVVVVSAMGEQTDDLIALAEKLSKSPPRRELDMLLTAGERISMALTSIALHDRGVPSVSLTGSQSGILTDETHGNARIERILGDRIRTGLNDNNVVIVAGFQGVSPRTKEITTLGRGGSDLSAIALAASLGASRCELYKDVDGVLTADPRVVRNAKHLQQITWDAMLELAWSGASVLHARGAHVAARSHIPIEIRSSFELNKRGTMVQGVANMEGITVQALAHKTGMVLVRTNTKSAHVGLLHETLTWLWERGETPVINHQQVNGDKLQLTQVIAAKNLQGYTDLMRRCGVPDQTHATPHVATVTMVGAGFWQSPETVRKVYEIVPEAIEVEVKNTSITICAAEPVVTAALAKLHREFIECL